ncbi:MAG: glycosyltransferase family 2 protein [Anaerolineae bacterium]|nr:glycosyltransferase family 2 protein [Anaerolineae bacterium]
MLDLGIVIVNWNTCDLLRKCLQTVTASQGDFKFHTIVVDNASTDGSPDMVRAEFPQVELIISPENKGYSCANNLGLRVLGLYGAGHIAPDAPRYALLLNPDTEVPLTALVEMVNYMDAHPEVGIAGPKLIMPLAGNQLDLACRRSFPTPAVAFYHYSGLAKIFPDSPRFARYNMTYVDPDTEIEVDSVVGAYMQVRREAIRAVGLLDETFFMYGEDLDWAFRIKNAGWKVMYHPQVIVKHIKRAASRRSPKAQFEFYRAMLIFYRKHFQTTTPRWMHGLVLIALLMKGGRGLWQEMIQPTTAAITS